MVINQKKVIFLSGHLEMGGASFFVLNICDGLKHANQRWIGIPGVLTHLGAVGKQVLKRGLSMLGPYSGPLLHEDVIEKMYHECSVLRPDAVVANIAGNSYDFLRFVPESTLRIAMVHSDDENLYREIERYAHWMDLLVCVSSRTREVMQKRLEHTPVTVIQIACGVPMRKIERPQTSVDDPLRILYLGRVIEGAKRVSLMMEVMRKTLDAQHNVIWTIAGDGPGLEKLRLEFASEPERVKTPGALDYSEIPALLASQDVFFLCSDFEGLPLSMLEAMGAGLVPVVSDLPSGISEVVDDSNGIRVPIHGADGYVDALEALRMDRERLAAMSIAAQQRVLEDYSLGAMAKRWDTALTAYSKTGVPDWSGVCVADAPPEIRKKFIYHPRLRRLRKLVKVLRENH